MSSPSGPHQSLTLSLVVRNAREAIAFYKKAFNAEELEVHTAPDGKHVMHAELRIGNSRFQLCDEMKDWGCLSPLSIGGTSTTVHIYVESVQGLDELFNQAIQAGAQVKMPLENAFWGDRYGQLTDPYGHVWGLITHLEDLSPEEVNRRALEFFKNSSGCGN